MKEIAMIACKGKMQAFIYDSKTRNSLVRTGTDEPEIEVSMEPEYY